MTWRRLDQSQAESVYSAGTHCTAVIWSFDDNSVIWSLCHLVTQSLSHLVIQSLGHSVTRSLGHSDSLTHSLVNWVTQSLGH